MNRKALLLCALLFASLPATQASDPISYREISMLLRNGEDQQYIINDATHRKLLKPLTAEEIQALVALHASPALLALLRDPATLASADATAAYDKRIEQQKAQALHDQQIADQAAVLAKAQQMQKLFATPAPAQPQAGAKGGPQEDHPEYVGKPLGLKFNAADGSAYDLTKLQGKVVLVDFWATWCAPCMQEVPNVVSAYKKYHDKGFEIVGISLDQDKAKMLQVTAQKGMTWPQYFDGKGWGNEISTKFGIKAIPSMWLVSKKGLIATTNAREDLEGAIEKLLAE